MTKNQNRYKYSSRKKNGCAGLILKGVIWLIVLMAWVWGIMAIFYAWPGSEWLKIFMACLFAVLLPGVLFFCRSFSKAIVLYLLFFTILMVWWQGLEPTNNKDWSTDVAKVSHGEILGDRLTMFNVRNFRYTEDGSLPGAWETVENWVTREYQLDNIRGLDIFLSYWASDNIAHIIMSWDFGHDQHLAISIETRKDKSQEYSAIKGFFKQFELSYVAADEDDIIRLRTNFRKERVYVYRLLISKERARALLEDYVTEMNKLVSEPEFYHALTRNCTTTIHLHANAIEPDDPIPLDWRIIASGHLDEFLYEHKKVNQTFPFAELRKQNRIDQRMQSSGGDQYSRVLREKRIP